MEIHNPKIFFFMKNKLLKILNVAKYIVTFAIGFLTSLPLNF